MEIKISHGKLSAINLLEYLVDREHEIINVKKIKDICDAIPDEDDEIISSSDLNFLDDRVVRIVVFDNVFAIIEKNQNAAKLCVLGKEKHRLEFLKQYQMDDQENAEAMVFGLLVAFLKIKQDKKNDG